jgi:hypothetical protein
MRLWRLEDDTRQSLVRRSLTESQLEALTQLWSDDVWSTHPNLQGPGFGANEAISSSALSNYSGLDMDEKQDDVSDDDSIITDESDELPGSQLDVEDPEPGPQAEASTGYNKGKSKTSDNPRRSLADSLCT